MPSVALMVSGFVGTVIGCTSVNAQQAVSFYYGGSKGRETKTGVLALAFTQMFSQQLTPKKLLARD